MMNDQFEANAKWWFLGYLLTRSKEQEVIDRLDLEDKMKIKENEKKKKNIYISKYFLLGGI